MSEDPPRQPIQGVFSQVKANVIGTGTSVRKTEAVTYFYARERPDGMLEVQALGDQVAFGPVSTHSLDEFLEQFMPEPQMSQERARAEMARQAEIKRAVAEGDKLYKQGRKYSAEFEYGLALDLDEENIRANFGIGLCFIARGETEKAREVLGRLVRLEAAFRDQHKHLFNEFGISLRKSGMDVEALSYYARALELSPGDENLHYNMARAAFRLGDLGATARHLGDCLRLNPKHGEGLRFMTFLKRKQKAKG